MITKQNILDNVNEYSAPQLVTYIREGVVTMEELIQNTDGEFSYDKRREVRNLLKTGDADIWHKAKTERNLDLVQEYLRDYPYGKFRSEARKLKAELSNESEKQDLSNEEDFAWSQIDKSDCNALENFNKEYPNSKYEKEISKLINSLLMDEIMGSGIVSLVNKIKEIQTDESPILTLENKDNNIIDTIKEFLSENKITKSELLDKINEDNNLLSSGIVKRLIKDGILNYLDLKNANIKTGFIKKLTEKWTEQTYFDAKKLDRIHKQSTEIYFWGTPSSGKTCALGAILSVANNGSVAKTMEKDTGSQGYGYMTRLLELFKEGEISTLTGGTEINSFYEMGFNLTDYKNKVHPITCIDMAGELMKCMYMANANENLDKEKLIMLETMTRVLIDNRTNNRKIHVFVIEYGAEKNLYDGLPQSTYLNGAVSYIKNTDIFKKETDAIYILLTKTDKAKNATQESLNEYLQKHYRGFINILEELCKDYEINNGKVEKIPFKIGKVCFQDYCEFDPIAAKNVVEIILDRTASYRKGKLGFLGKLFRS